MNTPIRVRSFAILLLAGLGGGMAGWVHAQEAPEKLATDVANDLANRRLGAVVSRFTPEMAKALPLPALDRVWSGVLQQGGAVREIAPARIVQVTGPGAAAVVVPIRFERMSLDMRIAVANDQVAGLFFVPPEPPTQTWNAPPYVDPTKFTNLEVTVGSTALGGTLSLPVTTAKVPAVVLIHGSGPNDRDETIGPNRPFRDIAEGLASRGVAALRYDKRTKVHPDQFAESGTVREETMDDAVAAVALLAARSEIDARRIVIVGHSLGGTLAPRIAAGGHGIAGVVIMAGATRPLPEIIVEQMEYLANLNGPADEPARKYIDGIKAEAARAMAAKAGDVGKIFDIPASYWADLNAYDPVATAAALSVPLLILQGGRDYQVTADDLQGFKMALAGHPNVTIREFPRLNHFFMAGDGKSRPEEYRKIGHVDAAIIEMVAGFVGGVAK